MKHENLVIDLVASMLTLQVKKWTPDWLLRPGKSECERLWDNVCQTYETLTGRDLPEEMPPRENRSLDAYLPEPVNAFLEYDEKQHFNEYRLKTYDFYPADFIAGYPVDEWKELCRRKRRLESGGFAKPKPPLFPENGGRHLQRAFRDALADLLPPLKGYGPTIRIGFFEIDKWINGPTAPEHMRSLLSARIPESKYPEITREQIRRPGR